MAYTYRFKDINNDVIYVGFTGQTMTERMNQHFTKGHLPAECYKSVASIEYMKWKTKSDAQVMEVYFINKYKPRYNKFPLSKHHFRFYIFDILFLLHFDNILWVNVL